MYWYINFKNEDWWKTEILKIGKHIGKRAKINGNLGYFFETIDTGEHNLFVYDERLGHNAGSYFEKNKHEWKDELRQRCWLVCVR